MEIIKLKCPQCNADLEIGDGIDTFCCKYCGCSLMLDGQSKYVVKAQIRAKELEHAKYRMQHDSTEKDKEYIRETERGKRSAFWIVAAITAFVLFFVILFTSGEMSVKKEEKKLESIVSDIYALMEEGKFDEALTKAEQIKYENDWSSTPKKKWESTRKAIIKEIKQKQKTYVYDHGIAAPLGSSDAKGMPFDDVVKQFEQAGFTNIQTVKLNEKSGLFSKSGIGDTKRISIGGDNSFKAGTMFIANSPVIISYYGLE